MYMTDEEALKKIEEFRRKDWQELWPGFMEVAANALRERVAAKKPKRPSLEDMEKACRDLSGAHPQAPVGGVYLPDLRAAADLIKYVCEHLVGELKSIYIREYRDNLDIWAGRVLSRLGVVV